MSCCCLPNGKYSPAHHFKSCELSTPPDNLFNLSLLKSWALASSLQVVLENMEEHSAICSQLDENIGEDQGLDAFLTRLANFIEQHAEDVINRRGITEGPLPDDLEDMDILMNCCRAAAALQPDSTTDPAQKCQANSSGFPSPCPVLRCCMHS